MRTISANADAATQTCEIRMKEPGLPNLNTLTRHLEQTMRVGATLRGVEAAIVGRVARRNDGLFLEISGTRDAVRLVPLHRKVQWDMAAKREQEVTLAERGAYDRLLARSGDEPIVITGPLTRAPDSETFTLEVRLFAPPPAKTTRPNQDKQP